MHLYKRFKVYVLGTSQGRHPTDIFWGRFEDVRKTFLQNLKNKHFSISINILHNTFGERDQKEYNSNVLCIVLKIDVLGTYQRLHYVDATLGHN